MSVKSEFRKKCEKYNIYYPTAKNYKRKHKELSDDEIIKFYLNEKPKTLTEYARENHISFNTLKYQYEKHPDLSIEEVIKKYKNGEFKNSKPEKENRPTIIDKCKEIGINYNMYREEIKRGLSHNEAIEVCKKRKAQHFENSLSSIYRRKIKEAGVKNSLATVLGYHYQYPNLTEDEVIAHFIKKELNFKEKLIASNLDISYPRAIYYKTQNPDLSEEEVIELIKNKLSHVSFTKKCRDAGIEGTQLTKCVGYRSKHKELSDEEIIEIYLKGDNISFKDKCNDSKIDYQRAKYIRAKYPHLTFEKIKEFVLDDKAFMKYENREKPIAVLCREMGVRYDDVMWYRKKHKGLSNEESVKRTIEYLNTPKEENLYQKCKRLGLCYATIYNHMKNYNISGDEAIQMYYDNQKKISFCERCRKYGIDGKKACTYKCDHKGITDDEVILHYRPDLNINIFGKIIE